MFQFLFTLYCTYRCTCIHLYIDVDTVILCSCTRICTPVLHYVDVLVGKHITEIQFCTGTICVYRNVRSCLMTSTCTYSFMTHTVHVASFPHCINFRVEGHTKYSHTPPRAVDQFALSPSTLQYIMPLWCITPQSGAEMSR